MRSRLLSLLALAAVWPAAAGCGNDAQAPSGPGEPLVAQRSVDFRLYWLGRSFDGLPLTDITVEPQFTSFGYGTCDANAGGEGGCALPLEIQVNTTCDRNALLLDIRPRSTFQARGVPALDYGDDIELDAGASHVTVFSAAPRGRRAVAALRPVEGAQRAGANLPEPRYPRYYLDQLRRVRAAYARLGSLRAVRDALRISRSAVRFELRLARGIAAARLQAARGAAPNLSEVKSAREPTPDDKRVRVRIAACELEPRRGATP